MSVSLATDLPYGSIDTSLAEVDARSRDAKFQSTGDIAIGPFSVIDMTPTSSIEPLPRSVHTTNETEGNETVQAPTPSVSDMPSLTLDPSSMMVDSLSEMDDFLHWSDLFDPAAVPSGLTPQPLLEPMDSLEFSTALRVAQADTNAEGNFIPNGRMITPQHTPVDTGSSVDVLTDVPFLLKHFQDHVIAQMMAMPLGEKSPWKILNVPAAVLTYSDMTFLGSQNINHARLANLYGILACSAYHLSLNLDFGSKQSPEHWILVADQSHWKAKEHMQISLKQEIHEPKKAKYKDQLMAICAMTAFAVCLPHLSRLREHR